MKTKDQESITIDSNINSMLKRAAKIQRRSYSNLIEYIAYQYLTSEDFLNKENIE